LAGKKASEILAWALKEFGPDRVILASSFSAEDQVLTDMLSKICTGCRVFTLDTGRHFQETYDVMQKTMEKYSLRYEVCVPEAEEIASLVAAEGPNALYQSREQRERCCQIRKIKPLEKILATAAAWICGLRRDQAVTRQETEPIAWDSRHGLYKVSPLAAWSEEDVWRYLKEHDVPYNALYDRGFRSIGCAPCTRATGPGEDVRAGRWWWEEPEHKECGLHKSSVAC